jgi:hypothetical protein
MIVGPPIGAAGIAGSCGKIYCLWHGKRGGHTLQCVNSVLLMYKFGFCGVFYAKSVAGKVWFRRPRRWKSREWGLNNCVLYN